MSKDKQHEKRLAVLLYPNIQRQIAELAKTHTLNQSEVIEVMLDIALAQNDLAERMKAKREAKAGARGSKTAILKSLSKLSAEQLEELAKMLPSKETTT